MKHPRRAAFRGGARRSLTLRALIGLTAFLMACAPPVTSTQRFDPELLPEPQACDRTDGLAIRMTVAAQLDAFALGDFDSAYALTSPAFKRGIPKARFETLIRTGYPELLDGSDQRFDVCRARDGRAFQVVRLRSGERNVVLGYDLSERPEGWRIDGARRLPSVMFPGEQTT